jgi:metal-sulfur cluster biosynthetic enzyme
MNERIKELKEQAMEWMPNQIDPDTKIRLLNAEKFAELIVKKCMDIAYDHTPNSEECEYKRLIHDKIRQHFGVER